MTDKIKHYEKQANERESKNQANIEFYKNEAQILRAQLLDLKKKLGEFDSVGPGGSSELSTLKKELIDRKIQLDAANKNIKFLQEELINQQKEQEKEIQETSKDLADYGNEKEKSNMYLRTRINDLQQKLNQLEMEYEISKNDNKDLGEKYAKLDRDYKIQEAHFNNEMNKLARFNIKLQAALAEEKIKFVEHLAKFSDMSNEFLQKSMAQSNNLSYELDQAKLVLLIVQIYFNRHNFCSFLIRKTRLCSHK